MSLSVKICGITDLADARFCAGAGADYLGFIQYPKSPRYIRAEVAAQLVQWVHGPQCVGVFVNEDAPHVNRLAELADFDCVQLHGDEAPELCERIERPVIKALRIAPHTDNDAVRAHMDSYLPFVDTFLLDTWEQDVWGGTGRSFDWRIARSLARDFPVLLSGGIGAHNVICALQQVRPLGIDLSSSLESRPGKKDFDKVTAFFQVLETAAYT